ncbi:MAG: site-specific DNA-methyltransferase [Patescibacteria group bacterium]
MTTRHPHNDSPVTTACVGKSADIFPGKQMNNNFIFTQPLPDTHPEWLIMVGDALKTLKTWPNVGVRLWLTSPPYKNKFDYGIEGQCGLETSVEEYVQYQADVAREMLRCSTPDANLFYVIQDSFAGSGGPGGDYQRPDGTYRVQTIRGAREKGWPRKAQLLVPERIRIAFAEVGWSPVLKIIWDKSDPRRAAIDRPSYSYEEVLAFSRDADGLYEEIMLFSASPEHYWNRAAVLAPFSEKSLSQLATAYRGQAKREHTDGTDNPSELKRRIIKSMKGREGAFLRAVWKISSGNQPIVEVNGDTVPGIASFPELLAAICVNLGSAPGDLVADPFVGMGTTLLAALKWGRHAMGVELSPRFAEAARARIKNAGF